ncbi:uncharacterized protein LOC135201835 isoform X2 [Macrobrachium nipponense]
MSKDSIGWPPLDRLDFGDMMGDDLDNEIIPVFVDGPVETAEYYGSPDEISRLGSIMVTERPYSENDWAPGARSGHQHNPSEYNMVPPQNAGVQAMSYETHAPGNNSAMSYATHTPGNSSAGRRASSGQSAESGGHGFTRLLAPDGYYPIGASPLNQLQQSSSHPPERGRRERSERRHHHHHHHHQTTGGFGGGQEGDGRRDHHSSSFPGEGRMEDRRPFP